MNKQKSIQNARTLLRQSELGVLSTHSKANEGYPFGSVSTYMSTVNGDAVFYLSDLAQHTKNLHCNAKMCLTVFTGAEGISANNDDPNVGARLSILGTAKRISPDDIEATSERFFALYPESRAYQGTHDFAFYRLSMERVRFIGGFGDIHWISKKEWNIPNPEWLNNEQSMIKHMNEDHGDAMQLMCQYHFSIDAEQVKMLTVNPDGCFLKADNAKPLYIPFAELAHTDQVVRQQLVTLTNEARAACANNFSKPPQNIKSNASH